MYKIGVLGDSIEYINYHAFARREVARVLDVIHCQYGNSVVFNLAGDIGIGEWSADSCVENGFKYHLFLPYPVSEMEELWHPNQLHSLEEHFRSSWSTTISFPKYIHGEHRERDNYHSLIDASSFVVCFWNGMRQGDIADAIRYAVSKNKLVLNGLNDLKMVTSEEIDIS